jgi:hypothetical protein
MNALSAITLPDITCSGATALEAWLQAEVGRRAGESGVQLRLALSALRSGRARAAIDLFDRLVFTGLAGEVGFLGLSLAYRAAGETVSAQWAADQAATLNRVLANGSRAALYSTSH